MLTSAQESLRIRAEPTGGELLHDDREGRPRPQDVADHARLLDVSGYPVLLAVLVSFEQTRDDRVELGLEQPDLGAAARARDQRTAVNAARSTTWTRWA